jgi:hypothetical protein
MRLVRKPWVRIGLFALLAAGAAANQARADEIRLKDGKKLYGVIVAYEDNMFKIKTDFGYVLVEKDKIASIIPDSPTQTAAGKTDVAPASTSKPEAARPAKSSTSETAPNDSAAKSAAAQAQAKREKTAAILAGSNSHPEIPSASPISTDVSAPLIKTSSAAPKTALTAKTAPPAPPKEEPPAIREEIQGNLYINHEFNFRMYKAPSWQIIDGAGQTLPNALVAMGTSNESTLLVIGREKTKAPLDSTAQIVEKRLEEVYENYRLISQRKTIVGGLPAIEYRYRGVADEHDWSGTLAVVGRGDEIFTVLGMTFADTDLIQIQENVIARSIASLDFATH